jgi:aminomethyltransferase
LGHALHYGSQVEEHHEVRSDCGVFDVSHMTVIDVDGSRPGLGCSICWPTTSPASTPRQGLYSPLLNEHGGVVDDLIVYRSKTVIAWWPTPPPATRCWLAAGAAGRFRRQLPARPDLAILAIQGPHARRSPLCSSPARAA